VTRHVGGGAGIMRIVVAVAVGLGLASLPFVYYRYGVGRHHARHAVAEVAPPADAAREGVDHASHPR